MELIKKSNGKSTLIIDILDNPEKQNFSAKSHIIDKVILTNMNNEDWVKENEVFKNIIAPNLTANCIYEKISSINYEEFVKDYKDILMFRDHTKETCGDCNKYFSENSKSGRCGLNDTSVKKKDEPCGEFKNTSLFEEGLKAIKTDPTNPLQPRKEWDKKRLDNITCSILRKFEENQVIPVEWFEEYNELVSGGIK